VLDVYEAERLVESIEPTTPNDVGSKSWLQQHRALDRLNVQAHHNVVAQTDEFVVEALISFEKLPVIVHELILIETWKHMCMPKLQQDFAQTKSAVKPYLMMYHEAVLCNLLECALFSLSACESVGDVGIVELVDYCTRKCTFLNSMSSELVHAPHQKLSPNALKELCETDTGPDLEMKRQAIEFSCSMTSLSILRFITDHMNNLEMSVMSRLINPHDIPMQLVPLLQNAPWDYRTEEGEIKRFIDNKWEVVDADDALRLNKYQAQVWLSVYNLVMDGNMRAKYDINSHRKSTLMCLRKYFNATLIDQLPVLADLQRTLEELNMMEAPEAANKTFFVLEQVATMREGLQDHDWEAVAEHIRENVLSISDEEFKKEMEEMANWYKEFDCDSLMEEPKCSRCGAPAANRCSRCKNEWYCGRECQVGAWEGHKKICDLVYHDMQTHGERDLGELLNSC
jgi:predicted Zn-ribbon and HTH transcriptional regulator